MKQKVALNYQTYDEHMRFNEVFFEENGKCGLVLKPEFLRFDGLPNPLSNTSPVLQIGFMVVCGEQLPKPGMSDRGEIVDPFVRLQVLGVPKDSFDDKSESVTDNGFNPVFNKQFILNIHCPELAVIRISVYDKNKTNNDFLCENYLPVRHLRKGCRSIPMLNQFAKPIDGCVLFGEIRMKDLRKPHRVSSVGSDRAISPVSDIANTSNNAMNMSVGSMESTSVLGVSTSPNLVSPLTPSAASPSDKTTDLTINTTGSRRESVTFLEMLND